METTQNIKTFFLESNNVQNYQEELTILSALSQILKAAKRKHLDTYCLMDIKPAVAFITKELDITPTQAMLLSVIAEDCSPTTISNLAYFFDCSRLQIMCYNSDLEALIQKRILCRTNSSSYDVKYFVHSSVLEAFKTNKTNVDECYKNLSTEEILEICDYMFNEVSHGQLSREDYVKDLRTILNVNSTLKFSQKIQEYNLTDNDLIILMKCCSELVINNKDVVEPYTIDASYFSHLLGNVRMKELRTGHHILLRLKLLEEVSHNNNVYLFKLTDFARQELLSEVSLNCTKEKDNQLTYTEDIVAKPMYYNPVEEKQIKQLSSLLKQENFINVQQRLKKNGLRMGFACLFYGAPGTGKTETVLQLAKQTGRNIMQVDISAIKSKWIGEGEKNIKAVFDKYRSFVKNCDVTPILLFNEADAIFTVRIENLNSGGANQINTIQNIILQEMENLNGILIATTNLSKNLDTAFERRFLYKIKFQRPSIEARNSIWKSMFPNLNDSAIMELATNYDFSGGQIENIARKNIVQNILDGDEITLSQLKEFCDAEKLNHGEKKVRKAIGFR